VRLFLAIAIPTLLGVALLLAGLWGFFRLLMARMRRVGEARLLERYPGGEVLLADPVANCLGLESLGRLQVRGNGVLTLTPSELWFRRYAGTFELSIPLRDARVVELAPSHLGKRILGRQLLRVRFSRAGTEDTIAWLVPEPRQWLVRIEAARQGLTVGP
jgi:hypothetical protein